MALLISHRGNTDGMNPVRENSVSYIKEALEKGYQVMVDLWLVGTEHLAMGTERALHAVDLAFLKENNVICHAQTVETLEFLLAHEVHCFYATGADHRALTNGGLIWTQGDPKITQRCIMAMPEWFIPDLSSLAHIKCSGICSDRIQEVRDAREKLKRSLEHNE